MVGEAVDDTYPMLLPNAAWLCCPLSSRVSVKSERAIQANVMIIRAFVRMRELVAADKDIAVRVDKLERSHKRAASVIEILVEDIDRVAKDVRRMKALPLPKKRKIGFLA